jgi:hypothetical protein
LRRASDRRLGQVRETQLAGLPFPEGREARLDEVHPSRQDGQRPKLAVREGPGLGGDLESDRPDARGRREREDDGAPAAGLDGERPGRDLVRETERGGEVFRCQRVEDLEGDLARKVLRAGVVDHDPQLGPVALAEEARQVGPDHEVLDGLGLLFEVPPARSLVSPWTKTRQPVTESGTVNSMAAVPSGPVRR